MPNWYENLKDSVKARAGQIGQQAGKALLLKQAAGALGSWLDRAGWTVETLDEALRNNQPVLAEAWQTIPVEALQRLQRLHDTIAPIAESLTVDDYPVLLQELAANPAWQAYAELLYHYHYDAFEQSVEQLRAWFIHGFSAEQ